MGLTDYNLKETVTYWAPSGYDARGNSGFSSPVTLDGRWEERTQIYTNRQGEEVRSRAVVFVSVDVALGGYLYLGTSAEANPFNQSDAYEIKDFKKIPNLPANKFVRQAML